MAKEDEVVDELMEQMKNPSLGEASFMSFVHRIEVLRGLIQK